MIQQQTFIILLIDNQNNTTRRKALPLLFQIASHQVKVVYSLELVTDVL